MAVNIRDVVVRLQELYYKYNRLASELLALKSKLSEMSEAKRILEKNIERRIYRELGGLIVEVTRDEALQYLSEEEELTRIRIEKLEAEQKKLLEEIRELERKLTRTP